MTKEKDLETQINNKNILSGYWMEFGVETFAMLIMRYGKNKLLKE